MRVSEWVPGAPSLARFPMQESEWGDILDTSDEEGPSTSAPGDASFHAEPGRAPGPSFSCRCSKCADSHPSGGPQGVAATPAELPVYGSPSRYSRIATRAKAAASGANSNSNSSSSTCTEGLPVSVLMLQYPLFFCDVDLPFTLELKRSWREIGGLASWTLSSAKDGGASWFTRKRSHFNGLSLHPYAEAQNADPIRGRPYPQYRWCRVCDLWVLDLWFVF